MRSDFPTQDKIRELLKSKIEEAGYPKYKMYEDMCDVIIYNSKIYCPHYEYNSINTGELEKRNPILQCYHDPSYCMLIEAIQLIEKEELPYRFAEKTDIVVCKCMSEFFKFNYSSYSLDVHCAACYNSWSAYSG